MYSQNLICYYFIYLAKESITTVSYATYRLNRLHPFLVKLLQNIHKNSSDPIIRFLLSLLMICACISGACHLLHWCFYKLYRAKHTTSSCVDSSMMEDDIMRFLLTDRSSPVAPTKHHSHRVKRITAT
jgi:hypothetical protein